MSRLPIQVDLSSAEDVLLTLRAGTDAMLHARCRRGSTEVVHAPGRLVATGDLHDHPLHLARVVGAAGFGEIDPPAHLTLHELIHSPRVADAAAAGVGTRAGPGGGNGGAGDLPLDLSHRVLVRVAALKARFPEHVHVLLANHELAQIAGRGIVKDGLNVVAAFNAGVEHAFGEDGPAVLGAINAFIRAMPLALRCVGAAPSGDLLCLHSLPGPDLVDRFDPTVLDRELTDEDLVPRRGSAHITVWGRGHTPELLDDLASRLNAGVFVLGHEKADDGAMVLSPRALVLNSDHERGVLARVDLSDLPTRASQIMTEPLGVEHA